MVSIKYALRDSAAARDGKWFEYKFDGVGLCIRAANYGPYEDRVAELVQQGLPFRKAQLQATVEELLVDWRGFTDEADEAPLPLDDEIRARILSDPDWTVIAEDTLNTAQAADKFAKHKRDALTEKPDDSTPGA